MKHPEYDSPFELVVSDITTQMAKSIDEMCWQAVQRVGINVDKEKMLLALHQDAERYRAAYANGYDTGYEKRDDDIVRCKDCKHRSKEMYDYYSDPNNKVYVCQIHDLAKKPDWYCADGERKSADEILMEEMDADPLD